MTRIYTPQISRIRRFKESGLDFHRQSCNDWMVAIGLMGFYGIILIVRIPQLVSDVYLRPSKITGSYGRLYPEAWKQVDEFRACARSWAIGPSGVSSRRHSPTRSSRRRKPSNRPTNGTTPPFWPLWRHGG